MKRIASVATGTFLGMGLAMADTNLDNLVDGVQSTFSTIATVAVAITLFFIGRKLIKRGAS